MCINGICTVPANTSLPATGVGIPHDTERVVSLALAAAAVLVAGRLIRNGDQDPER